MVGMVAMRFKSAGRAGLHTTHPKSIPQSNGTDCWTGLLLGLAPGRSRSKSCAAAWEAGTGCTRTRLLHDPACVWQFGKKLHELDRPVGSRQSMWEGSACNPSATGG